MNDRSCVSIRGLHCSNTAARQGHAFIGHNSRTKTCVWDGLVVGAFPNFVTIHLKTLPLSAHCFTHYVLFKIKIKRLAAAAHTESWDILGRGGCTSWILQNGDSSAALEGADETRQPSSRSCEKSIYEYKGRKSLVYITIQFDFDSRSVLNSDWYSIQNDSWCSIREFNFRIYSTLQDRVTNYGMKAE